MRAASALAALVLASGAASAQGALIPATKAAFLYNFAKFAEWPAGALAPGQTLTLCVIGDTDVADALRQIIGQQVLDGHELAVRTESAAGPGACHVLYLGGLDPRRSAQAIDALKGASVLSVSDGARFAELGGVAQLIVENDRMRFAINPASARRARITLSSKLLSLATIVKDDHDVQH